MRLSFQATPERLAGLAEDKAIQKLDSAERRELLDALASYLPTRSFTSRDAFDKVLAKALKGAGVKIGPPVKKAILLAFCPSGTRPPTFVLNSDGKPEPDTELRDHELVPLNDDLPYGRALRALPLLWHMDAPFGREHLLKMRCAHSF